MKHMASGSETEEHPCWKFVFKSESSLYNAVVGVLKGRADWAEATSLVHYNLLIAERWEVPWNRLGKHDYLRQAVNHQRGTKDITLKGRLVRTLRAYCGITNTNASTIGVASGGGQDALPPDIEHAVSGNTMPTTESISSCSLGSLALDTQQPGGADAQPGISCVHIPRVAISDIIPESYCIREGEPGEAPERRALIAAGGGYVTGTGVESEALGLGSAYGPWICKRTAGTHGDDIHIAETVEAALSHIDSQKNEGGELAQGHSSLDATALGSEDSSSSTGSKQGPIKPWQKARLSAKAAPTGSEWVVQRYIASPMLIGGRKFDIRAFVLLAHDGCAYFYHDWIVRTCSEEYDLSDLSNQTAHISNNCLQLASPAYGLHEDRNMLLPGDFRAALLAKSPQGHQLFDSLVHQMQCLAAHTIAAVSDTFEGSTGVECFQMLGYDFMPSEDGKMWLLEVNGSPTGDVELIPRLAQDMVPLAIDSIFPPHNAQATSSHSQCGQDGESTDTQDLAAWRLIFSPKTGIETKPLKAAG